MSDRPAAGPHSACLSYTDSRMRSTVLDKGELCGRQPSFNPPRMSEHRLCTHSSAKLQSCCSCMAAVLYDLPVGTPSTATLQSSVNCMAVVRVCDQRSCTHASAKLQSCCSCMAAVLHDLPGGTPSTATLQSARSCTAVVRVGAGCSGSGVVPGRRPVVCSRTLACVHAASGSRSQSERAALRRSVAGLRSCSRRLVAVRRRSAPSHPLPRLDRRFHGGSQPNFGWGRRFSRFNPPTFRSDHRTHRSSLRLVGGSQRILCVFLSLSVGVLTRPIDRLNVRGGGGVTPRGDAVLEAGVGDLVSGCGVKWRVLRMFLWDKSFVHFGTYSRLWCRGRLGL